MNKDTLFTLIAVGLVLVALTVLRAAHACEPTIEMPTICVPSGDGMICY